VSSTLALSKPGAPTLQRGLWPRTACGATSNDHKRQRRAGRALAGTGWLRFRGGRASKPAGTVNRCADPDAVALPRSSTRPPSGRRARSAASSTLFSGVWPVVRPKQCSHFDDGSLQAAEVIGHSRLICFALDTGLVHVGDSFASKRIGSILAGQRRSELIIY
jgi:hypothetical protein